MQSGRTNETEALSDGGDGNPRRADLVEWALVVGIWLAGLGAALCFLARRGAG